MDRPQIPYPDRRAAGGWLAQALTREVRLDDPVVLALPRGGLPVAAEVAAALDAPLDVLLVRKLGAPGHPELGVGAVGEGGIVVLDEERIQMLRIPPADMAAVRAREQDELNRRITRYRGHRPAVDVAGRDVVLVDDGIATGVTARAAVRVLRERGAARVVMAVPVGASAGVAGIGEVADVVVCPVSVDGPFAVGAYYRDFGQLSDEDVVASLQEAADRSED